MKPTSRLILVVCALFLPSQVARADIVNFNFPLNASQETSGSTSSAVGTCVMTLDTVTHALNVNVSWTGLAGAGQVTKVHFHKGLSGENGTLALEVVPPAASPPYITSPVVAGPFSLTATQQADLLAGSWYLNVHSVAWPNGEIRGQAFAQQKYDFHFPINAFQETDGSTSKAHGFGHLTLDPVANTIQVLFSWTMLDPPGNITKLHFHRGRCGENGPFQIDVVPPAAGIPSPVAATLSITPAQAADILNGLWYVNLHSTAWPNGEMRGQVTNLATGGDQLAKLLASDGAAGDSFGNSVAASDSFVVVGAPSDDDGGTDTGSVYVYRRNVANWLQMSKFTANDRASGDNFGWSVAINGDTILVGAPNDDDAGSSSGSAYVYVRNDHATPADPTDDTWDFQAKLVANDAAAADFFGWSVGISGDYAIIGAFGDDDSGSSTGSAYIFKRTGVAWAQQAKLHAGTPMVNGRFGYSVAIDADTAVVGAQQPLTTATGAAYVFVRSGVTWPQQAQLIASDVAAGDRFGSSVSVSGDVAIVGSPYDSDAGSQSGSAYLFKRIGVTWAQEDKIVAHDAKAGDNFGWSVQTLGDNVVVEARRANGGAVVNSGGAYLFARNVTCWLEASKVYADDAVTNDEFGYFVGLSPLFAAVGSPGRADHGVSSGACYVFLASGKVDCNENGRPDAYDILIGTSEDCNHNGVPDECQSPCVTCPDSCFESCGTLVPGNPGNPPGPGSPCQILFAPDIGGGLMLLDKLNGFVPGDRVRVEGCLDLSCSSLCPTVFACVHCNTVERCDPCQPTCSGICVDECGELVAMTQGGYTCIVFRADTGESYFLDELQNFVVGDHVHVRGCTGTCPPPACGIVLPCIKPNIIETCSAGCGTTCPMGQLCFEGCGVVTPAQVGSGNPCLVFVADSGGQFLLSEFSINSIPFGTRISVKGCIDPDCVPFCAVPDVQCLYNVAVAPCDSCAPGCPNGTCIDECGDLFSVTQNNQTCVLFQADTGLTYYLENFGDFLPGDHVHIRGCIGSCAFQLCGVHPCIVDNTVESCSAGCGTNCPNGQLCFEGCGFITVSQQPGGPVPCLVFVADAGGQYLLSDYNPGQFPPGSRLSIKGCVDPNCIPECLIPGIKCLYNVLVAPCDPCLPGCPQGTCIDECGELVSVTQNNQTCVLFKSDTGLTFYLENLGDFVVGDHIQVRGCIGACPILPCGLAYPCIAGNTVESCSAGCGTTCPNGQLCFEGCGFVTVTQQQGGGPVPCLVFVADSGGGQYLLSDYNPGQFPPGTRLSVKGCIDPNCTPPCNVPGVKCLYNVAVAPCDPCLPGCPQGTCIDECGELVSVTQNNQTCVVFQSDTGLTLYVENYGDFVVGDHVHVRGCIGACPILPCGLSYPCVTDNTVESCSAGCGTTCPNSQLCFEGCGFVTVSQPPGGGVTPCLVFVADAGGQYLLSDYNPGQYPPGTRLSIKGCIDPNCVPACAIPGVKCLYNVSVAPCDPCLPGCPQGTCIDECGELVSVTQNNQTCTLFKSDTGLSFYVENLGDFVLGDHVHVRGCIGACPILPCGLNFPCITDNTIESCSAGCGTHCPNGQLCFEGCGIVTINQPPGGGGTPCLVFVADAGGQFVLSDYNADQYPPGTRLSVKGCIDPNCTPACAIVGIKCLYNVAVAPCDPCLSGCPGGTCFDECGRLVSLNQANFTCVLFDSGQGIPFYLENLGDFSAGDLVRVRGCSGACPISVCGGFPCITGNTIEPCIPGCDIVVCPTAENCFSGCGTLTAGQQCILFVADAGGTYVLSNHGNFSVGQKVEVTGCIDPTCTNFCNVPGAKCLYNDSIRACPCTPCPNACFEGCGIVFVVNGCLVFAPEAGGGLYRLGGNNLGPVQPGYSYYVSGCIDLTCQPNCAVPVLGCLSTDVPLVYCEPSCPVDCQPQDCFRGCGQLVQGVGCVYFRTVDDQGNASTTLYKLDNQGAFVPGDFVFVTGCLIPYSDPNCFQAATKVANNTISGPCHPPCLGCPPNAQCFNGCGTLIQGSNCVLFHTDTGNNYQFQGNLGGVNLGDVIFISGCISPTCQGAPPGGPPCSQPSSDGCITLIGQAVRCQPPTNGCATCPGDLNGDQVVDGRDIQAFINCMFGSLPPGGVSASCSCADIAPTGGDGAIDAADVDAFVQLLLNSVSCPPSR